MRRILVSPDGLVQMAGQLRRSHYEMAAAVAMATRRFGEIDADARSLLAVAELIGELERLGRMQAPALERLVRFLEWKAESFREADEGAERIVPEPPPSVMGPAVGSGLSLAPQARESRPSWLVRVSGGLKVTAGVLGFVGAVTLFGMATGGIGFLFVPAGLMVMLHSGGDFVEGLSELASGRDEKNRVEELYAGLGGETGRTVYTAVDWGLTILDGGIAAKGFAKGAAEVAAEGTAKAAAKFATETAMDGGGMLLDLANKTDLPGQVYDRVKPKP